MIIFVDVLLLTILVFSTVRFGGRGLICSIFGMGKFILAFLLSIALGSPVGILISNGFVGKALSDRVYSRISGYFGEGESVRAFFADIPEGFLKTLRLFGADVNALQARFENASATQETIREMADVISAPISRTISAILAYIVIFVAAYIALSVIVKGLRSIKIPIITRLDKLLGGTLGFLLGILGVALISTALYSILEFASAIKNSEEIMNVYSNSHVFKFIYDMHIFEFIRKLI